MCERKRLRERETETETERHGLGKGNETEISRDARRDKWVKMKDSKEEEKKDLLRLDSRGRKQDENKKK